MFHSIFKFFINYVLIQIIVISLGLVALGLAVNSVINWTWLVYFFVIFRSLIHIIWFLPFEVIFGLLGSALFLYSSFWTFRSVMLVYNWLRISNR